MSTSISDSPLLSLAQELQDIIYENVFDGVTYVGDDYRAPSLLRALRKDSRAHESFFSAHDTFYKTAIFEIDHTHLAQWLQSRTKHHITTITAIHIGLPDVTLKDIRPPDLGLMQDPIAALPYWHAFGFLMGTLNEVKTALDDKADSAALLGLGPKVLQVKLRTENGYEIWTSDPLRGGLELLWEAGYLRMFHDQSEEKDGEAESGQGEGEDI